jgi:hypothetical protein
MTDPILVFAEDDPDERRRLVVNFGMFAGRQATPAEVERLGESLLPHAEAVEIVCEERYRFDSERSASVYQVRVELPRSAAAPTDELAAAVEEWARDCLAERRLITP